MSPSGRTLQSARSPARIRVWSIFEGSAVIPGLTDNHDHLYNSAKVMRGIDLVGATSTAEVLRRLRDGFAKAKPG